MSYVLALDQGTTSSRALVFDDTGNAVALARREFPQLYPQPGWVEHDPEAIWTSQSVALAEALTLAGIGPEEVAAVGITNQRETTLLWDRFTGEPVYNAIVWQDRRTAPACERLIADGLSPRIAEKTGLVIDPYFSATKLAWLLENVEGVRERAERGDLAFGTVDTYLIWKLTNGTQHVTDVSNASRTLLFNIHTGQWDEELLALFKIPPGMLPTVAPSSGVVGTITGHPLAQGIPIAGIAGDQQAALFGQACFEPGMAKNTYGTGCFLLLQTGTRARLSRNRLLTTVAWQRNNVVEYALEGSVFIAGAVVQWLRDGFKLISSAAEVEALAASVPDTDGVYLVPAFSGLGAPYWDPHARGTIVGITRGTTAGHLARAALEAIAFQSAEVLEAMQADAGQTLTELRVDGGVSKNDLLMQFQADLLQVPVVRPTQIETTALGAAYLAGLATDVWDGPDVIRERWQVERRFEPRASEETLSRLRAGWHEAVARSRNWAASV